MRLQPGLESGATSLELLVDGRIAEAPQDGDARGGGERISGQGPGLVHVPARCEAIHDLGSAAERGQRQPAADDLPEDGEVRHDAEQFLRAASGNAEAGDDLVEHEQRSRCVAEAAKRLEEAGLGRDDAHVPRNGLDDDRGEALAVLGHGGCNRVDVVVLAHDRVLGGRQRNAGARRQAERRDTRAGTREERIDVAVVATRELEDAVARRERASKANGAHGRLGPGRDEADLLDRGDSIDDLRGELDLCLGRRAEARAALGGVADRGDRFRVRVPKSNGPHDITQST